MKYLAEDIKKIYLHERFMLVLMIINLLGSIVLFIYTILHLHAESAIVKVGYGDIGGYRSGSWTDMLTFLILAVILGIFHNVIALRIYHKRGAGMTKFFLLTTSLLIIGAFIVLARLTGEG